MISNDNNAFIVNTLRKNNYEVKIVIYFYKHKIIKMYCFIAIFKF